MTNRLPDVFSKNRNEESREDNWSDFVVPPFLDRLGIKTQSKAAVIMGGRGCGKTTLLRYFCHATQFSPRRPKVSASDLSHIGLYWRADTNFLNSFIGGEQTPETWRAAFEHLLACELGKEIIRSLRSLNCNPDRIQNFGKLDSVDLSLLKDFDESLGQNLDELERSLQRGRTKLAMWVNNLDTYPKPQFLPADSFLKAMIETLKGHLWYLSGSTFSVFIDEYENLRNEQQCFINGLLKHGGPPLLYNIAMKRNGWQTSQTMGAESIQDISDYRVIDLENELEENFDLFAAELLFFRLTDHDPSLLDKLPIVPELLRSVNRDDINRRYDDKEYRERVLSMAEKLLPRVTVRDAAIEILNDHKLKDRLLNRIKDALKNRNSVIDPSRFINDNYPEASILMPALLNRPRENPDSLLHEFDEIGTSQNSRLSKNSSLIQNNLFGCVNSIYIDAQKDSILFSGFTAITLIAHGNIRHLLELIHRIFISYKSDDDGTLPIVPPIVQAKSIKDASASILSTVSGHGTHGARLYALALCLGSIFRELHRNERQSESEINHFTIASGEINTQLEKYLSEAEKWSVLFLSPETKMKSKGAIDSDYILNPIFSPFFQVSFRKKRSIQLTAANLIQMLEGDQSTRDRLVRELGRVNNIESDLFGDLKN